MHPSGSFLKTFCERLRGYLDEPNLDAKFNEDFIVRNFMMPAMVDVHNLVNSTSDVKIINRFTISLKNGVERYQLPPCIQEIHQIVTLDNVTGDVSSDYVPRGKWHRWGPSWLIEGNMLVFRPWPALDVDVQLWYVSNGDMLPHYATTGTCTQITVATASWTEDTMTLTKASGFANYTWHSGDMITITSATNGTTGDYAVVSKTDPSNIVLATSPGSSASAISARLWVRTVTLATSPEIGQVDRREKAYCGQMFRFLPSSGRIFERTISDYTMSGSSWIITLHFPFDVGTSSAAMTYEIAPYHSQALAEAIITRGAMKGGAYRKISQSHMVQIQQQAAISLKTLRDSLSNFQLRTPMTHAQKNTVDNPGYWVIPPMNNQGSQQPY